MDQTARSMRRARGVTAAGAALIGVVSFMAGCAIEWQNAQPAQELARQAAPPGSVTTGEAVFLERCAGCHGPHATGTARGPDLLPRVEDMGPRRFVNLVLRRYDWIVPPEEAGREGAAREALLDQMVLGQAGAVQMPAWQGTPRVQAHIIDLYAYLSARAAGTAPPPTLPAR